MRNTAVVGIKNMNCLDLEVFGLEKGDSIDGKNFCNNSGL